ncbi:nickel pincer cofactor biosynthesis protein LarC [Solidesulfovibrio sp.]
MADRILVLRTPSGISGDMFVSGLAGLCGLDAAGFAAVLDCLGVAELRGAAAVVPRSLGGIAGVGLAVSLPLAHAHRRLGDILAIIAQSAMADDAKALAAKTFRLLAQAEAMVHGTSPEDVHFHEVGALDSLLDVCVACELFVRLAPAQFVCSPLPVCDGTVRCAHGILATPAPAVLHLLAGLPVYGIKSQGETVTPTAAALLRAMEATFGPWPALTLDSHVRAYGGRVLPGVPNGAIFALGRSFDLAGLVPTNPPQSVAVHAHNHGPQTAGDSPCTHTHD